jgi:SAM-dependent methyltransferase
VLLNGRVPTIPAEPGRPGCLEAHRQREMAESFGIDPGRYDRTRPRYPDALVARIAAASPGPDVLDVGCGTGGQLAAFWPVFDPPADVAEATGAAFRRLVSDSPLNTQAAPPSADRIAAGFTARAAGGVRAAGGSGAGSG